MVGSPVATVVHGTHDLGVHARIKATSAAARDQKHEDGPQPAAGPSAVATAG